MGFASRPSPIAPPAAMPAPQTSSKGGVRALAWLPVAVACQFCWGIYPAGLRFLQTESHHPLTSLQLSFLINLLAMPALFFGTTLPLLIIKACKSGSAEEDKDNGAEEEERQRLLAATPAGPDAPVANGTHQPTAAEPASAPPLPLPAAEGGSDLKQPLLEADHNDTEQQQQQQQQQQGIEAQAATAIPIAAEPLQEHQRPDAAAAAAAAAAAKGRGRAKVTLRRQVVTLVGTTIFLIGVFLAQVFSLLFITAYMSQMVFLLAPVIVAFMAKALFKSPLPKGLWTALFFMLMGCSMVMLSKAMEPPKPHNSLTSSSGGSGNGAAALLSRPYADTLWAGRAEEAWLCTAVFGEQRGQWVCGLDAVPEQRQQQQQQQQEESEEGEEGSGSVLGGRSVSMKKKRPSGGGGGGLGMRDAIGIGLSFMGALSLAAFMTLVQRSQGVVSEQQVLWSSFLVQCTLSFTLTYNLEYWRVGAMKHMGLKELGQVALLAAGVNWGCNFVQQLCIKNLGAPQTAAFLPVRLLGSLAASYPLLHESLEGPWQWGGALLLMAAVSWYLLQQKKAADAAALQRAMAEAEAGTPVLPGSGSGSVLPAGEPLSPD